MKKNRLLVISVTAITTLSLLTVSLPAFGQRAENWQTLIDNFCNPPADCRPHTIWWWMGNAVTKEEITWELEQMHDKGIGGVQQLSMGSFYEKGSIPYLSEEFLEMLKHVVKTAKRLGMNVSLNFGGPGWIIGGAWVPQEDHSKDMVPTFIDLKGPQVFSEKLPTKLIKTKRSWEIYETNLDGSERLLAVVAGKLVNNRIDEKSLVNLTSKVKGRCMEWQVPEGNWRLMAFWLKTNDNQNTVDHVNKGAMQRYCNYLGGKFYEAFGEEFGKTVDSFFCDSFEVPNLASGIYWTTGLFKEFKKFKGYDLTLYLPAIWWQVGNITPKIRYDVNEFLHHIGLEAFFKTFLNWCQDHGVKGRIQPYGFLTDNIEGAGLTHKPEMECTPGEKDAVPWFDTRIGPKKYVASGAHLYDRNIVSVEAYTYLHWQPYRATLEELKIASDGYLRSGANKFYNHGYNFSPERDVAFSRGFFSAIRISHENIWWKYYPLLARYIARCSYLLRQGDFAPDIAVYSPLANQWTLDVLNARKWTREFHWGQLGNLLIANGYDFDLLNDDVLQNRAQIEYGKIKIRNLKYKILILPNIRSLPLETMEFIRQYVHKGGIVIALETVPDSSVGLADFARKGEKVKAIVCEMFKEPSRRDIAGGPKSYGESYGKSYGKGQTYYIKLVINRQNVLDWRSSALDPFVNTLRHHLPPDFGIDFALEGLRENNGLTFIHRKLKDTDIYFVTNIQDKVSTLPVTFRVKGKVLWKWNPYNGEVSRAFHFCEKENGTEVPIRLAPYESAFFVFKKGQEEAHVEHSNFYDISHVTDDEIEALAAENGNYRVSLNEDNREITHFVRVADVPAPYLIAGRWKLILEGQDFPRMDTTLTRLSSWTKDPRTKHFSGTGRYEIDFVLPDEYAADDIQLLLDLGKVGNIAEVELNGENIGTVWMRGQRLNITEVAKAGANRMRLLVTNTLINRVSGFKELPPVPEELIPHYGRGIKRPLGFAGHRSPIGFRPLPASGLMGPVKILAYKKVILDYRSR